jgi:hypothetical protein
MDHAACLDGRRESPSDHEGDHCRHRVDEQPPLSDRRVGESSPKDLWSSRRQSSRRANEGGDGVVHAERPRAAVTARRCGRNHRLLEGGERSGLHHLQRQRSGERGEDQKWIGIGQGEDRPGHPHAGQECPVQQTPAHAVGPPHQREGHKGGTSE